MTRYLYSLVRCVPDPRTGEFINIGAIVGDPATGDWSLRQVSNESRVLKLAGPADLEAVHGFLARIGQQIYPNPTLFDEPDPLDEAWLQALFHNHRNVVQISAPMPIVADNAEQALDLLFDQVIIDPTAQPRSSPSITKHRILSAIREAYTAADIDYHLQMPKAEIHVGEHIHTQVDFAIGNGSTVQLAQGWSFQRLGLQELSTQVKAWGYALARLREGERARVISSDGHISNVDPGVDLEVVVAPPLTSDQTDVYEEAGQVFSELHVTVRSLDDASAVGRRAAELLEASASQDG